MGGPIISWLYRPSTTNTVGVWYFRPIRAKTRIPSVASCVPTNAFPEYKLGKGGKELGSLFTTPVGVGVTAGSAVPVGVGSNTTDVGFAMGLGVSTRVGEGVGRETGESVGLTLVQATPSTIIMARMVRRRQRIIAHSSQIQGDSPIEVFILGFVYFVKTIWFTKADSHASDTNCG